MPVTSKEKVAAIDVLVDGSPISPEFRELLHEWHGEICAKTSIKEPNFERLLCATG